MQIYIMAERMYGLCLPLKRGKLLACVSASGYSLPRFMIYSHKRINEKLKEGCFLGTVFACSDNGWVTTYSGSSSLLPVSLL